MVTVSSLRDQIILLAFSTEDYDLFSCPSRVLFVHDLSVSSNRVMCPNNPFDNGTTAVCRKDCFRE